MAEGVVLVLTQDPVAAVVDDQQLGSDPVLGGGAQLGERVLQATVANDGQDGSAGVGDRGADRRRPGVAQRPRSQRVQELLAGARGRCGAAQ